MASSELASRSFAIVNGEEADEDEVVALATSGGREFCTGTLVSPHVVVTAAHCVYPNINIRPTDVRVVFGLDSADPVERIAVKEGHPHPDWTKDKVPNDIGILVLEEPSRTATPPMLPGLLLKNSDMVGETVRMVGYGITRSEDDPGIRRAGDMVIDRVDEHTIYLSPGPSATCNGDSGGPLFLDDGEGEMFAGIHSRSDCESDALNERVDIHVADFIVPVVREVGDTLDNVPSMCAHDEVCNEDCIYDRDCGPDEPKKKKGGGCNAAMDPSGAAPWVAWLLLGLIYRRRRNASSAR
jgi:uncharacterized protein (TIGR03382 family)